MKITGHPDAYGHPRRTATPIKHRPDRVAFWAVLLGISMVLMAVLTSHGA